MSFARRQSPAALLAAIVLAASAAAPRPASAQWLKQIKQKIVEHATEKVIEHGAKAESTIVKTTDKATDSALTKTNRGLDTTMARAGAVLDTGINRTEREVKSLFAGRQTPPDQLVADLTAGRVIVRDIAFATGSAQLTSDSEDMLKRLAAALASADGAFLVEGHVDATTDPAADHQLSEQRAATVKARLVAFGVSGARLFAMGYGATQPLSANASGNARIELAKMK